MFQEWGFLLTEIWVLLLLAALLGLVSGWLMFGNGTATASAGSGDLERLQSENARLQSQIMAFETRGGDLAAETAGKPPEQLDAPRGGQADDLKRISGIGPRMEQMCNMLGFWHYDQIAKWTDEEVAWVDQNLQGFKGRVTRDDWVPQAKILAEGGETEFSKQQDAKAAGSETSED